MLKTVIHVYLYGPIKKQMFHNTITHLSFQIFVDESVWHDRDPDCGVFLYEEYLERICQKWKFFTLAHIFACNSISILLQRASHLRHYHSLYFLFQSHFFSGTVNFYYWWASCMYFIKKDIIWNLQVSHNKMLCYSFNVILQYKMYDESLRYCTF